MELDSLITKLNIFRNAALQHHHRQHGNLSIQHDLTRKQTIELNNVKQEAWKNETYDTTGNYRYRVRGPPGRWRIVKI